MGADKTSLGAYCNGIKLGVHLPERWAQMISRIARVRHTRLRRDLSSDNAVARSEQGSYALELCIEASSWVTKVREYHSKAA